IRQAPRARRSARAARPSAVSETSAALPSAGSELLVTSPRCSRRCTSWVMEGCETPSEAARAVMRRGPILSRDPSADNAVRLRSRLPDDPRTMSETSSSRSAAGPLRSMPHFIYNGCRSRGRRRAAVDASAEEDLRFGVALWRHQLQLADGVGDRNADDLCSAQRHHYPERAVGDRTNRMDAKPGREHPVEGGRRATALDVPEHRRARFLACSPFDLLGEQLPPPPLSVLSQAAPLPSHPP